MAGQGGVNSHPETVPVRGIGSYHSNIRVGLLVDVFTTADCKYHGSAQLASCYHGKRKALNKSFLTIRSVVASGWLLS